jgi:hypothetical protein
MNIIEIKDEISDKIHNYLKFNNVNLPLILEVEVNKDYLENILIWLKGKLYVIEIEDLVEDVNYKKLYLKLQLINNIPMGWKITYSENPIK